MASSEPEWFLERHERVTVRLRSDGATEAGRTIELGLGFTERDGQQLSHRFLRLDGRERRIVGLPEGVWPEAERLLTTGSLPADREERLRALLTGLGAGVPWSAKGRLEVNLIEQDQQVLIGSGGRVIADRRRFAVIEQRAVVLGDGRSLSALRENAFGDGDALLEAGAELQRRAAEAAAAAAGRASAVACHPRETPVVMPAGADAGVFFHELCGHPLEGDVVSREASYLSRRSGEQVAPSFVSLADDPCGGPGEARLAYRFDDEGTPAAPAMLLREGRVGEALLDRRTAAHLGRAPNGHGRRLSYRHAALPRMTHTHVLPHRAGRRVEEMVGEVPDGIWIDHLTPRHVNLLSGEFSFFIDEAREIRDGQLGRWLEPALLRGEALSALGAIDEVGADARAFFGIKGCGKLDQGGLHVSFGMPAIRFRALEVRPWR